jgi:hypothetical protein
MARTYNTNQNVEFGRKIETAYAGGNPTGLIRSKTKMTDTDVLGFFLFMEGSKINMPLIDWELINMGGSNAKAGIKHRIPVNKKALQGDITVYHQGTTLINMAGGATIVEEANPAIIEIWHWQDGMSKNEAYGVHVVDYTLEIPKDGAVSEKVTVGCFNSQTEAVATSVNLNDIAAVALLTTAFAVRNQCSISIAAADTIFETITLSIKNKYEYYQTAAGFEAILAGRDIEITFTTPAVEETELNALHSSTITPVTVAIATGKYTYTVTDCQVVCEARNEVSEMSDGLRVMTFKAYPTIASVVAIT